MPNVEEFRSVAKILLDGVPAGTDISSLGIISRDGHWIVTVRTRTPGHVIGRRGTTADAIRAAMAAHFGDPRLQLNIEEAGGPTESS